MAFPLIVVGTSLGGFSALKTMLRGIPGTFNAPIAIVQHRDKHSGSMLRHSLQQDSALPIQDVEDKDPIRPGQIYLAPANYHLLIEPGQFALSTDPPVMFARPSIDVLFESAAEVYRDRVIGVVLTGANRDGAQGLAHIKTNGGFAIVQDPKTAYCPVMPEAAIAATTVDSILPLEEIVSTLVRMTAPFQPVTV